MELDVSKIIQIPSDTEIPVSDGFITTQRSLCTSFPKNKNLLNKIEAIVNSEEYSSNSTLFDGAYNTITSLEDLKKVLSEVLIRFDTDPDHYTKGDYGTLMRLLYSALLYLYERDANYKPPVVKVNEVPVRVTETDDSFDYDLNIGTTDEDHLDITTSEEGSINITTKIGEMETPSTKLATVNDIRNYIEKRLEWQVQ